MQANHPLLTGRHTKTHNVGMGEKRAYGSGSIREVRSGVFLLRWIAGTDPLTGKYLREQETFKGTKKAAQTRLGECVATAGRVSKSGATVGQLRAKWETTATVTTGTMERYRYALAKVPAAFWTVKATDVDPPMIADLYRRMTATGSSAQNTRKAYTALSSMFRHGVEWGVVERNPCRNVRPPTIEPREYVIPTPAHLRAMIDWADSQRGSFGIWMRVMIATGVRKGELLALQWRDVDLDAGRLHVRNSMRRKGERAGTKTKSSTRVVYLDELTAQALRQWHTRCVERAMAVGARVPPGGFVMSDDPTCATTITLTSATQRQRRLSERVGCPGARVHDLRHAHATMLLEAGVSPRTVADRLGHSRVSTTLDIYGHLLPGADRAAADTFAGLLNPAL